MYNGTTRRQYKGHKSLVLALATAQAIVAFPIDISLPAMTIS